MKVLKYPHPILKYKCKPVQKINQELRDIAEKMCETMYETSGVGLAANQVGLPMQLLVMNPTGNKEVKTEEYVFINPVILKKNGNALDNEGCLSFPDIYADVVRAEKVEFEAITLDGEVRQYKWTDRPARIFQHELDHLNGVSFVDHLPQTAKMKIKAELEDMHTIFEGDQRLGFISTEEEMQKLEEYERKFC